MKEQGVLINSEQYFHIPSDFAKNILFYPTMGGRYYCSTDYETKRESLKLFLFIFVKRGKMEICYKNEWFVAEKNDLVFLDCYSPHLFRSLEEDTYIEWIHFDGRGSREYFDLLYKKGGCVFQLDNNYWGITKQMTKILNMMKNEQVNEHASALAIHQILCELIKISNQHQKFADVIKKAISFIEDNYKNDITLLDIAKYVNLSPYHFSRLFKEQTNYTPHQFLLNYRINYAKNLLYNSDLSIVEIAYRCGFNSDSHFVTTFKKHTGFSPKKYQNFIFKIYND